MGEHVRAEQRPRRLVVDQRVAIRRIGACMTSIGRPFFPNWMVSDRVTAVIGIESRMLRPFAWRRNRTTAPHRCCWCSIARR